MKTLNRKKSYCPAVHNKNKNCKCNNCMVTKQKKKKYNTPMYKRNNIKNHLVFLVESFALRFPLIIKFPLNSVDLYKYVYVA